MARWVLRGGGRQYCHEIRLLHGSRDVPRYMGWGRPAARAGGVRGGGTPPRNTQRAIGKTLASHRFAHARAHAPVHPSFRSVVCDPGFVGKDPDGVGTDPVFLGTDPVCLGKDPEFLGKDPKFLGKDPGF